MSKVVLITGANSGVGFELARLVAEKGHIVYIGSRNADAGKKALETLHSEGLRNVKLVIIDVTSTPSIEAATASIAAAEGKLDVLVNNAGISKIEENQNAVSPSLDVLREVMDTNFYGAIQTTAAFIPLLRQALASGASSAVILNVTSGLGSNTLRANSTTENYDFTGYNASKAALNSYTITLARTLKGEKKFKVNAATPGYSATKLTGGMGQPVKEGAKNLLPWVLIGEDGPSGKSFGVDQKEVAW